MLLISFISQIFPFILLKDLRIREEIYSFAWYIFIASAFTFFDLAFIKMHIEHYFLYNAFTPIEIGFFFYIPLKLTNTNEYENLVTAIITTCLTILIVFIMAYSNILDTKSVYIECITSLLACGVAIGRMKHISIKDYRVWIITGISIYAVINCYTYPEYNMLANILMNIFFAIALIIYGYKKD